MSEDGESEQIIDLEDNNDRLLETQDEGMSPTNKQNNYSKGRWDDLYNLKKEKLRHRETISKEAEIEREENSLKKCTFVPNTIQYLNKEKEIIYEKPEKHYSYGQEIQKDKNSLCETLFSGRIRTTNVILPDYGTNECLHQKHCVDYIERQEKLRKDKEKFKKQQESLPGSGKLFNKKVSRVTVPTRTILFSENAFSLREVKNSIKSVKKPIAPHKFSIGYEAKNHRKNPFRISTNLNLSSDEADKNIMNLNAKNHNDLIQIPDGISYEDAISQLKKELKNINIG